MVKRAVIVHLTVWASDHLTAGGLSWLGGHLGVDIIE
jgi:hypothetical protein